MSTTFTQLWLYNNWANTVVLEKLKKEGEKTPHSCLRLFSHIVNAQAIWLSRLIGEKIPVGVWDEHSISDCQRYHQLTSEGFAQQIQGIKDTDNKIATYTNTQHQAFHNKVNDILLHVFNHGTYHRAQIASEMRRNGVEPINTDYITFIRLKQY